MSKLTAGTFKGTAPGHNGDITVALTTDGERITDLKLVKEQETPHVGDNAFKWLPEAIVKKSIGWRWCCERGKLYFSRDY